jgi:succinate dehydrogenase / fumarate reductase iron-sulfur subunit
MDGAGFGSCSNEGECEAVCPKEIRIEAIARMNRDYLRACLFAKPESAVAGLGG